MRKTNSTVFNVPPFKGVSGKGSFYRAAAGCVIAAAALILVAGVLVSLEKTASAESPLKPPANLRISAGPQPGAEPLDPAGDMRIGEADRCPVCAMRPANYPEFAGAIRLKDGRTFYFCGTGCMIKTWMHPEVFLGMPKSALDRPAVRDYFTGESLDARDVTFIAGSDLVGPMGPRLVPVNGNDAVAAFRKKHGGKSVFRLDEMTDARWEAITGHSLISGK